MVLTIFLLNLANRMDVLRSLFSESKPPQLFKCKWKVLPMLDFAAMALKFAPNVRYAIGFTSTLILEHKAIRQYVVSNTAKCEESCFSGL